MARLNHDNEGRVGIFWLCGDELIIDTSLLSQAEVYGDVLGHATGHDDHWAALQRQRLVPSDVEYLEYPRGRVGYYKRLEQFWLRADRCILQRKAIVQRIKKAMNLPDSIIIEKDEHYRCSECLRRERRLRGEDEDE